MTDLTLDKILNPDEQVSKEDSELMQLRRYYELKIEDHKKGDVLTKPRELLFRNRGKATILVIVALCLYAVFFYLGIRQNNILYLIPAMIGMVYIVFFAMLLQDRKIEIYQKNFKTLDLLLKVRSEAYDKKENNSRKTIPKNAIIVYETLKEMGESNLTNLLHKLKEKGHPFTEKTVRNYLREELKDMVDIKTGEYNSKKRFQKEAKVYYIKEQNIGK